MSGDIKYHLGTSIDRTYPDGRKTGIYNNSVVPPFTWSLVANPSHLECVDGKVRAKQYYCGNR
jgi:2-oxoglutarate dehydrogenase E1 component